MEVGFTGTQKGMSAYQMKRVREILYVLHPEIAHHGDCIGADEQFHNICQELGIPIVIHPPIDDKKRAYCQSGTILTPKDYIARNHDIVDACDNLIVTPYEFNEQLRSGTWATFRYANKKNKTIHLIYPLLK